MAVTIRRKSKAERGDTLTLRMPVKDKFALELLGTIQDRTLSSIVIEALQEPLRNGLTIKKKKGNKTESVYLPDVVFDPLVPDRLVKLAMTAPNFLSQRDQVAWKVISENPAFWSDREPKFNAIRDRWDSIQSETDELLDQFSN